ncbi:uncharacterized protein METZ01_LOCUS340828, partial [marine metagenome]
MTNKSTSIPKPVNEPILTYLPGSIEKTSLKAKLHELKSQQIEVPLIIGGEEIKTGQMGEMRLPHDHQHLLGSFHKAGEKEVKMAIDSALTAWKIWSKTSMEDRAIIFLKAADLLAGPWRDTINAATMLNMSKNAFQAEVDAACEMIDFFRFNAWYSQELREHQPMYSPEGMQNTLELRP